ncbi:MAG: sulfite exporter TauE/SafE family protein [Roseivirga sp.]|nr:sulfite exporter TauE/SafE family protein [Roseivirga sp.]
MLLSTAILVGLLGSFHCLGMCAPITWAVPGNRQEKWRWLGGRMIYNSGRVVTYAGLGIIAGLLGSTFSMAGWQQGLSIGAGALMLLGVLFFGMEVPDKALLRPLSKVVLWVKKRIGGLLAKKGFKAQLALGMLNGLLPCGLVYAALIAALSMGSVQGGALYMALFGLGTFPMMLAAALFGKVISQRFKQRIWSLAPKLVAIVGILFILRGLNLGIPYVSPALSSEHQITDCIGNETVTTFVSITKEK